MISLHKTHCCAVLEMDNLSSVAGAFNAMKQLVPLLKAGYAHHGRAILVPFVIFTGVTERQNADHASNRPDNYGQALADFIELNKLGSIMKSNDGLNLITYNKVAIWIWQPDYLNIWEWQKQFDEPIVEATGSV